MAGPRVLHVLDHSLPHLTGYAVRSHYVLLAQMKDGVEPVVVTSPKHGRESGEECIDGVTYRRTTVGAGAHTGIVGLTELRLMRGLYLQLQHTVQQQSVDIIHAHSPTLNGIPALWAARRAGVPVVYEIRGLWEDAAVAYRGVRVHSARYGVTRAIETWLLRRVDAVGVISNGLARDIIDRGIAARKIFLAPNGVDPEHFRPAERDAALAARLGLDREVVVGFIGSLYSYEGLELLLQAVAAITPRLSIHTLLVGDGPERLRLLAEARRLGISARVALPGAVSHAEIRRWYSVCDILVYPRVSTRLTELTTPLKPLEAMAMGKVVVGSDVGGLRELIRDGETGVLVPAGDAAALAGTLEQLAQDTERRATLGRQARRFVCQERDWQHTARAAIDTYRKLLDGTPQRQRAALQREPVGR